MGLLQPPGPTAPRKVRQLCVSVYPHAHTSLTATGTLIDRGMMESCLRLEDMDLLQLQQLRQTQLVRDNSISSSEAYASLSALIVLVD